MMPVTNPYFTLQERIIELIAAADYFKELDATTQLLTEKVGDLDYLVLNALLPVGFGVVVTTAAGKAHVSDYDALLTDEDFNLSIIHSPTVAPDYNALDAQWAAIQALHGQTVLETAPAVLTERDYIRVTGHQRRMDAPEGVNVREIHLTAGLRLL